MTNTTRIKYQVWYKLKEPKSKEQPKSQRTRFQGQNSAINFTDEETRPREVDLGLDPRKSDSRACVPNLMDP